jgi:hypothetical protein
MGLREFLAELRHRGVLKVATAYLAGGLVVLEAGTHLLHNFEAPHWVLKVFSTLVIFGFFVACLMAWGFEFKDGAIHPAAPMNPDAPAKPGRADAFLAGLLLLVLGLLGVLVAQQWRTPPADVQAFPSVIAHVEPKPAPVERVVSDPGTSGSTAGLPIVVIMDTPASHGVYERETRDKSGTNADDLNEALRDLPIRIFKETVGATWDREDQVLRQAPDLILIHRSSFFHSMNQEFGFGYPGETKDFDEKRVRYLYELADNKLIAVLGYIGQGRPGTLFIVYSRGTGGGWTEDKYRVEWVGRVEGRFPVLKGRVTTLDVPGGPTGGSFDDVPTRQMFREQVKTLLKLSTGGKS